MASDQNTPSPEQIEQEGLYEHYQGSNLRWYVRLGTIGPVYEYQFEHEAINARICLNRAYQAGAAHVQAQAAPTTGGKVLTLTPEEAYKCWGDSEYKWPSLPPPRMPWTEYFLQTLRERARDNGYLAITQAAPLAQGLVDAGDAMRDELQKKVVLDRLTNDKFPGSAECAISRWTQAKASTLPAVNGEKERSGLSVEEIMEAWGATLDKWKHELKGDGFDTSAGHEAAYAEWIAAKARSAEGSVTSQHP